MLCGLKFVFQHTITYTDGPEALHNDPEFDELASALHAPIARPAPTSAAPLMAVTSTSPLWNGVPVHPLDDDAPLSTPPQQGSTLRIVSSTAATPLHVRGGAEVTADAQTPMAHATETLHGMQQALDAFQPAALQGSIQDAISSIRNMQQSVTSLSGEVQTCMEQLKGWSAPGTPVHRRARREAARQRAKVGRRPYSPFLAEPFIKVGHFGRILLWKLVCVFLGTALCGFHACLCINIWLYT